MNRTFLDNNGKAVAQIKVDFVCEIFDNEYKDFMVCERMSFDDYNEAKKWVKSRLEKRSKNAKLHKRNQ